MHSFSGPECYVGMGHINQTRLGANGQKALEMTVYTMAQEEGENRPSALKINGCGLYKGSYFDRVRPKKLTSWFSSHKVKKIKYQANILFLFQDKIRKMK